MAPYFLDLSLNNRGVIRARVKYGPLTAAVVNVTDDYVVLEVRINGTKATNMHVPGDWIEDVFPVKATSDPQTVRAMLLSFEQLGDCWQCVLTRDLTQYKQTATRVSRARDEEMNK